MHKTHITHRVNGLQIRPLTRFFRQTNHNYRPRRRAGTASGAVFLSFSGDFLIFIHFFSKKVLTGQILSAKILLCPILDHGGTFSPT